MQEKDLKNINLDLIELCNKKLNKLKRHLENIMDKSQSFVLHHERSFEKYIPEESWDYELNLKKMDLLEIPFDYELASHGIYSISIKINNKMNKLYSNSLKYGNLSDSINFDISKIKYYYDFLIFNAFDWLNINIESATNALISYIGSLSLEIINLDNYEFLPTLEHMKLACQLLINKMTIEDLVVNVIETFNETTLVEEIVDKSLDSNHFNKAMITGFNNASISDIIFLNDYFFKDNIFLYKYERMPSYITLLNRIIDSTDEYLLNVIEFVKKINTQEAFIQEDNVANFDNIWTLYEIPYLITYVEVVQKAVDLIKSKI